MDYMATTIPWHLQRMIVMAIGKGCVGTETTALGSYSA